tara:strand:+ start:2228 stop:3391 length:1164 start_codon:yes stop_codon:yes gene_type:complete
MKIVQVIPQYIPAYRFGGPLRVAHSIGKALVEKGHKVSVITTNMAGEGSSLNVPINKQVDIDGVKVFYFEVKFLRRWAFCPSMKKRLNTELKDADFIFSHFHYQYPSALAGRYARKKNIPLIVFSHGSLNRYGIRRRKNLLKQVYIRIFESKNFLFSKFIAFNCEEEKNISLYREKGVVIYNGISLDQFKDLPNQGTYRSKIQNGKEKLIFLFLGRLNFTQKGLNKLLPAFKNLTKMKNSVHLILVGPDEFQGASLIESEINNLGLNQFITMTGELNDREKLGALVDADVFILPSPSEGMSIALLEALFMNIPIITTIGVGLNHVIAERNAGYIVKSKAKDIETALIHLCDDKVREDMVGNGRKIILENHIWENIVSNLLKKLRKTL